MFNFVFADDAPEKREITKKFLANISAGNIEIFISETVVKEIDMAPEPKKAKMKELIAKYNPSLLS